MEATPLASAARAGSQHSPVDTAKYEDEEADRSITAEERKESGGMPVVSAPTSKAVVGVKSGEGG